MGTAAVMQRQTPGGLVLPLPSPLLAMLPDELQGRRMQWWTQPANALNVLALQGAVASFQTDASHYAAFWYGCVSIRTANDQATAPDHPATVLITDTHNLNYQPGNVPADIANVFGSAKQPAIWPSPLIVAPNSGLNIAVTNLHAATAVNFRFAYLGVLIEAN